LLPHVEDPFKHYEVAQRLDECARAAEREGRLHKRDQNLSKSQAQRPIGRR
jgi:hypothetical protein